MMGRRRRKGRPQKSMFLDTGSLPEAPGHPFYERLNAVLDQHGFDAFVEDACSKFYSDTTGRPSLPPGTYFRLLLVGYFEGIGSERGIAWRVADSLSLRTFLGFELNERTPDHSTLCRARQRIDLETHQEVFGWVLRVLADEKLLDGKTIGVDTTTLEANAALRSIVRRDDGTAYRDFLVQLARESGIETPTREDLARLDRKRSKKGSNDDWTNPHDPDATITKMKDGRTHLAHKAVQAVDMGTGAIVHVNVTKATDGDTEVLPDAVVQTQTNLEQSMPSVSREELLREMVADKGFHCNATMAMLRADGIRSYVAEPNRGRRRWKGCAPERDATYANRRRVRGNRGKRLQRQRGELLERPNEHLYLRGGLRRVWLRGHANILKRLLVHTAGFNLGLVMRKRFGSGTPRALWGLISALWNLFVGLRIAICRLAARSAPDPLEIAARPPRPSGSITLWLHIRNHQLGAASSTGC